MMMKRVPLIAVLLTVVMLAGFPSALGQSGENVSAGERLSGVVDVHGTEIQNEVELREYEAGLSNQGTEEAKASFISGRLDMAIRRAEELEERVKGNVGTQDTKLARIAVETRKLRAIAVRSENASQKLSSGVVMQEGIPGKIRDLRSAVDEILVPEVEGSLMIVEGGGVGRGLPDLSTGYLSRTYDSGFSEVPGIAKTVFGSERMNVYIETVDGRRLVFYLRTRDGEVVRADEGKREDATLRVVTSERVVRRISNSGNTSSEFVEAIDDGDIKYQGVGLGNSVKYGAVAVVRFIMDSIGSFVDRISSLV